MRNRMAMGFQGGGYVNSPGEPPVGSAPRSTQSDDLMGELVSVLSELRLSLKSIRAYIVYADLERAKNEIDDVKSRAIG
jgi:hypothetical protein